MVRRLRGLHIGPLDALLAALFGALAVMLLPLAAGLGLLDCLEFASLLLAITVALLWRNPRWV